MKITPEPKFGVIQLLCRILLDDRDDRVRRQAAESLGKLSDARAILALSAAAAGDPAAQVRIAAVEALFLISNYEDSNLMSDKPKSQPTFSIQQVGNMNTGDVEIKGDQIGIQQNYNTSPEIQATIAELKATLAEIQTKHPAISTPEEALVAIDAEFTEVKQTDSYKLVHLRQFILEPKCHIKAIKATISEISKHYLEHSVWAKAIITYLENLID